MLDPAALILTALVVDTIVGDPAQLYRHVTHPVVLIGYAIKFGDRHLNAADAPPAQAMRRGALLVLVIVGLVSIAAILIHTALAHLPGGAYLEAILASTLIAFRGLFDHVRAVALALDKGLDAARESVAHIVGRDPDSLDEAGVARAAVESAAENFSDGVLAPVFWGVLLGLPGLAVYKAINTLDSMIGHRTPRHLYFGRVAARLDDMLNWVPARLSGMLFCLAAALAPGADARQACICMFRDARKHRSPNAGWPEAAVAGALGIALAGPRHYASGQIEDAWIGHSRKPTDDPRHAREPQHVTAVDIHRALRLYLIAGALLAALLVTFVVT